MLKASLGKGTHAYQVKVKYNSQHDLTKNQSKLGQWNHTHCQPHLWKMQNRGIKETPNPRSDFIINSDSRIKFGPEDRPTEIEVVDCGIAIHKIDPVSRYCIYLKNHIWQSASLTDSFQHYG